MEGNSEFIPKSDNIRYQPRCANKDTVTETIFGSYQGSYEYIPIDKAIENIPDPYGIFPKLETSLKDFKNLSNAEITQKIAEIVTTNTDIPIIIEPFQNYDQLRGKLDNGNVYFHQNSSMEKVFGIHSKQYEPNQDQIDFKNPKGNVILINQLLIDDKNTTKTIIHELGHIVEEKILDPDQERTEVVSAMYGYKMAKILDFEEVAQNQKDLYDFVLTGNVNP
ncbi:MAG TPA: hypothetical protein PK257_00395 [Candidatus Woesebacteria bacterium]|nr:hypothetical protein [Candidatus Woesebacteria bacterium]